METSNERPSWRPRRLDPETLKYLKEVSETLLNLDNEGNLEDIEMLLWNVLEELQNKAASAASDRNGCEWIELFVEKSSPQQLRHLMNSFHGYHLHLWTNRYSSHVLQKIFSKAGDIIHNENNQDQSDDPEHSTPPMSSLITEMCTELETEWVNLACDISASHVVRANFCLLSGVNIPVEKRGKSGKHRAIKFSASENPQNMDKVFDIPDNFELTFQTIIDEIFNLSCNDLKEFVCDTHAGPVVSLFIRLPSTYAIKLIKKCFVWDKEEGSKKAFYKFSGNPVGSHFVEAVFDSVDDEFFESIVSRCLVGQMIEYCQHNISNYVVQSALKRACSKESIAKMMIDELLPCLWTLLDMGRPGVIWHLMALCKDYEDIKEKAFSALKTALEKRKNKDKKVENQNIISLLLSLRLPSKNTASNKLWMDVAGANIVHTLFEFGGLIRTEVVECILSLDVSEIIGLAKDGLGSRCIIEPIWINDELELQWKEKLFRKLENHIPELAINRCGAFSIMKAYEHLPIQFKIEINTKLLKIETKLAGAHFGQLVMKTCQLHDFKTKREQWTMQFEKKDKLRTLFQDLTHSGGEMTDNEEKEVQKEKKGKKDKKQKKRKREKALKEESQIVEESTNISKLQSIQNASMQNILQQLLPSTPKTEIVKKKKKKSKKTKLT